MPKYYAISIARCRASPSQLRPHSWYLIVLPSMSISFSSARPLPNLPLFYLVLIAEHTPDVVQVLVWPHEHKDVAVHNPDQVPGLVSKRYRARLRPPIPRFPEAVGVVLLPGLSRRAASVQPELDLDALVWTSARLRGQLDVDVLAALRDQVRLLHVQVHGLPLTAARAPRGLPGEGIAEEL